GFQFQHIAWRTLVEKHEGKVSMSRKGNCYDNAVIENFFSHLKTEMYHGETFNNIKEFTNAIDEYINWYNNQRLQERLNGQTPMQYRNQTLQALTA
ncbi:IS3 family transposase, partial [Brevibacterium sp. UMB10442]|nr:IS3 family transposase [Brevibacterium sp. UMB10442]